VSPMSPCLTLRRLVALVLWRAKAAELFGFSECRDAGNIYRLSCEYDFFDPGPRGRACRSWMSLQLGSGLSSACNGYQTPEQIFS
jgi:hypothetical protein